MTKCYRGGDRHKFVPRYTEEPSGINIKAKRCDTDEIRSLLILKKYVKDVCEWCGKEVKRNGC